MNEAGIAYSKLVQSAMCQELLQSERRRVHVLIALLSFLMVVLLVLWGMPSLIREDLRAQVTASFNPFAIVVGSYLAYEVLLLKWLNSLSASRRSPPPFYRYLNTLVEVSLPTVALAAGGSTLGALPMLVGAVPFVYFPFLCLSALSLEFRLCVFAGVVAAMEFLAASLLLIRSEPPPSGAMGSASPVLAMLHSPHQWLVKASLLLVAGLIAGFVAHQIRRQLAAALKMIEERDLAVSIFGQHVSPQVAELLLKQPMDFAGQERNVCIMFCDIRDFSRIAGERAPAEVVRYLNTLFGSMIPVVNEHQGIINKFLGDGFMAVFGAPVDDGEQCRHAVECGHSLLDCVERLNREQAIPPTRIGIGLHLGTALTGNVGGGERKEYTVIGDVVNLAARIEQATKQFNARLLASEAVVKNYSGPTGEDLGPVELKGQTAATRLFRLA